MKNDRSLLSNGRSGDVICRAYSSNGTICGLQRVLVSWQCKTVASPVQCHERSYSDCSYYSESNSVYRDTSSHMLPQRGLYVCVHNKRFYVFLFRSRVLRFLTFFPRLLFLKTLSKAKYEYAKIQGETLLENASAMISIDFGLLRSYLILQSTLLTC